MRISPKADSDTSAHYSFLSSKSKVNYEWLAPYTFELTALSFNIFDILLYNRVFEFSHNWTNPIKIVDKCGNEKKNL